MKRWLRLSGWLVIPFVVGGLFACAGVSWKATRKADTIAGYHRYLRENPDSRHSDRARERLEYLRVRSHPTAAAFEAFEKQFPQSKLLGDLGPVVEPLYFELAREENSAEAYERFLDRYPEGAFAARAWGNRVYREKVQRDPSPARLREFVDAYPESDFTPLAHRTLEMLYLHDRGAINRLAIRVRVGPSVTGRERVRRGFAGVVHNAYADYGVQAFLLGETEAMPGDADAWMQVDYNEVPAEGLLGSRTVLARCRVRLFHRDLQEPVWDRTFEAPAEHLDRRAQRDDPTVFGSKRYGFWDEFFVPVSTWPTSRARLYRHEFSEPVQSLDVLGERAVVLLQDGSLEYLDLSNPLEPSVIHRYHHERDLTRWSGVVLLPAGRAVSYGPDGAEVVDLGDVHPKRVARWERLDVGVVQGGARSGETVLIAGEQGMYAVRAMQEPVTLHRLTDEPLVGVAVNGLHVHPVSSRAVMSVGSYDLVKWAVTGSGASAPALSRVALPSGFNANRAQGVGDSLFVFGEKGMVEVGLDDPHNLFIAAQVEREGAGYVRDVAAVNDRLFVLGKKGLEVSDRGGQWVSDLIQVEADQRLAAKDRFLVLTGGSVLEIVDAAAYRSAVASPAKP